MSRQAQLPPRCPFQKKTVTRPNYDPVPPTLCKDAELHRLHHRSTSQSSILEEQPSWLDDLLGDSDSSAKERSHRRSASDSMTLLDGLVALPSLNRNDDENSVSSETGNVLESACIYGPNSPRGKGKTTFPDNVLVSALSEYASRNPMQFPDGGSHSSEIPQFDSVQDAFGSAGEVNDETKTLKRHSGQRSRVRKLQYIAELEKTVDIFQNLESELVIRVASVLQQRVALSMENNKLKQRLTRLEQEKLIMDAEYQSLRKEVERLKVFLAYPPNSNKFRTNFKSSSRAEAISPEVNWQMLDMGKLDLNSRS